jgi:hypothetical protein
MRRRIGVLGAVIALTAAFAPAAGAQEPTTDDPRVGLAAGLDDAGVAQQGMELLAHRNKPDGFRNDNNPGDAAVANSDMAFQGNHAFVGNFNGFNIYDISNPANPTLTTSVVCPGGQGDLSVYGNLLFMSVEATNARVDCSSNPAAPVFRGVRIFDISNLAAPVQVAGVQTCRGSHTHTLLTPDDDPDNVYVYVSGTSIVRPDTQLAGCDGNNTNTPTGDNPSKWRIEVIKVPLAAPQNAAVVSTPRLFANEAGAVDGLQNAPQTTNHPSGMTWGPTPITDACHDITVYEELDLAAGACEGNGLLIDISDPANPVRIDAVADPVYAYWHGATFSNDGKKVVFTDEWGGGTSPRCREGDDLNWGANAIYEIVNRKLVFRSYYKIRPVQTAQENCVSHIPSLVPVPGRDILVQAWYQGGASLVDFTDPAHPKEIGYYDRGPISSGSMVLGGLWSTYWYNGRVYGTEIARGFDVWKLTPTADLSAGEIAAAENVKPFERLNVQSQESFTWQDQKQVDVGGTVPGTLSLTVGAPASFGAFTPGVARSYEASTTANVISTAADAVLSVSDPSSTVPGRLVNDTFSLAQPLQARARNAANTGTAFNNVGSDPLNLLEYDGPISNDAVSLQFRQSIGVNEALRTGRYGKTLTFTLSTANP